jgi:hypothetical protein
VTEAKRGAARDDTPLQMDDEQVSRVSFATPEIAEQALLLVVSPALDAEGARTRGTFDGAVDGRVVVCASRQPFLDAARALLAEGLDAAATMVMRHAGSNTDSLRGPIGKAARLDVKEGPCRFIWAEPRPDRPPVRQNGGGGT